MPQLDRIIVFSQIFWLFITFIVLYTILLHFFLPLFLKSLKSRKQIVEANALEAFNIENSFLAKQNILRKVLTKNLVLVKKLLTTDSIFLALTKKNLDVQPVDIKVGNIIRNIILYCDSQLLNFLLLKPKPLNLKFRL
nr:ATP synthase F0 subunit 8 [Ahnfeltia plicata]